MWCDLGFVPNSRGNKAAANLRPTNSAKETNCSIWRRTALGPFSIHPVVSLFRLPRLPLISLLILRRRRRPRPLPSSSCSAADGRDAATADVRAFRWCSTTNCTPLCIAAGFRESDFDFSNFEPLQTLQRKRTALFVWSLHHPSCHLYHLIFSSILFLFLFFFLILVSLLASLWSV